MNPRALLSQLDFTRDVVAWRQIPPRAARFAEFPPTVHPRLRSALAALGITHPYTHQAQAIQAALSGQDIVLTAGTAGGKSLAFQVPILDTLLKDAEARALCLFPTKALAQDQLARFIHLLRSVGLPEHWCQTYDGDTPQAQRSAIRREVRVLITNLDMLHVGILPHHPRWASFFRQLRYVVVDELHSYRGLFGGHAANVLRRLKRLCSFYCAAPTFVLASATIANAREHAERLIERPVHLVDEDGSPSGERHVLVVNPPLVDESLGLRRSAEAVACDIAAQLIQNGLQTLCFARSRLSAETLLSRLRERLPEHTVMGYRGGYLPEERRQVEQGLRQGSIRGVVATNALELGIDIGGLDACVMLGYPGSIASFWQQAGRAGRRQSAALAIMVATADPLDQFLAAHPDFLFGQSPERAQLAPNALGLLAAHVPCAAYELPFLRGERLGSAEVTELLDALAEMGLLHASGLAHLPLLRNQPVQPTTRYVWVGSGYPAESVNLRGVGAQVEIVDESGERIGQTERHTAPARVHPGAVYLHQGQTYLVTALDLEAGRATVRSARCDYFTQASTIAEVCVGKLLAGAVPLGPALSEIVVTTRVPRYRKVHFSTRRTLGWEKLDLPEQSMDTVGYWFAIAADQAERLDREGVIGLPNRYGPNWQKQRDAARARDGYRCVICGAPEPLGRQHHVHHRIPFRKFGYRPGENDAYLQANALDNLMTVCPTCHAQIETAEPVNRALGGLCYALANLAPLWVMCDPSDLAATYDIAAPHTSLPTITLYEQTPGGAGLADELVAHHWEILAAAAAHIRDCPCTRGCPSCVGPVLDEDDRNLKQDVLRLLAALQEPR